MAKFLNSLILVNFRVDKETPCYYLLKPFGENPVLDEKTGETLKEGIEYQGLISKHGLIVVQDKGWISAKDVSITDTFVKKIDYHIFR
jgi:hypothetical protein